MTELSEAERRRVEQTISVRDTDVIPKVPDAGTVRDGVQVMHNGVLIEEGCYHGVWMTEVIRQLRGHHEPQEEVVFHAMVQRLRGTPDPVMIELGAFWAYYSLWFAHELPGARCLLVEPDASNLETGRRNFALNGKEGTFVHAAVGVHGATTPHVGETEGVERDTLTVSVDGLLADHGVERLSMLLCDVQGAEHQAIAGLAGAAAAGRLRFVLVSTHHHCISGNPLTHQQCLAALRDLGAHVICEHTPTESCSGDGMIAASFDPADRGWTVPVSVVRAKDSLFGELEHDLAAAREEIATLRIAVAAARATPPARRRRGLFR